MLGGNNNNTSSSGGGRRWAHSNVLLHGGVQWVTQPDGETKTEKKRKMERGERRERESRERHRRGTTTQTSLSPKKEPSVDAAAAAA